MDRGVCLGVCLLTCGAREMGCAVIGMPPWRFVFLILRGLEIGEGSP